uniref:Uncharacterized protein n=1 Tax=Brassica oleracea var. oleracea TaxID=109376 RepID=A0A0D2ZTB6_BRAOL
MLKVVLRYFLQKAVIIVLDERPGVFYGLIMAKTVVNLWLKIVKLREHPKGILTKIRFFGKVFELAPDSISSEDFYYMIGEKFYSREAASDYARSKCSIYGPELMVLRLNANHYTI